MEGRDKRADLGLLADAFFAALRRDDCEYGGWGLDSKRPFGNSDVEADILIDVLKAEPACESDGEKVFSDDQCQYAGDLYEELGEYLQAQWTVFRTCGPSRQKAPTWKLRPDGVLESPRFRVWDCEGEEWASAGIEDVHVLAAGSGVYVVTIEPDRPYAIVLPDEHGVYHEPQSREV